LTALLAVLPAVGCSREDTTPPIGIVDAPPRDPELLQLSGAVARAAVPAETAGELLARIRIQAAEIPGAERPPMNLAVAIDTSGSMDGDAMDQARAAALAIVDQLRDGDRLAVVSFGSRTKLVTEATVVDASTRGEIRAAIESMNSAGTTDLAGGLSNAVAQVLQALDPNGVNRVVLLSDGVPNDPNGLQSVAEQARANAVSITALGLGLESDEVLLTRLAQHSGGRYHFVESPQMVAKVFHDEVLRMDRAVARNLQLQLQPGPGVVIEEVVGLPWSRQGSAGAIAGLGDLSEGETRDVVVRLRVGPHRDGASVELADAYLSFEDTVIGAGVLTREGYLSTKASSEDEVLTAGIDTSVEASAEQAMAAAAILRAIDLQRAGQIAEALAQLSDAESRARAAADRLDDPALNEAADEMLSLREMWPPASAAAIAGPQAVSDVGLGGDAKEKDEIRERIEREELALDAADAHAPRMAPSSVEFAPPPPPTPMSAPRRKKLKRSHAKALRALQPYAS
jgi:Ca-activated chloride channel family protein